MCPICKLKTLCVYHEDAFLFAGHHLWNLVWKLESISQRLCDHVKIHVWNIIMWSVPKTHSFTWNVSLTHGFTCENPHHHMWIIPKIHGFTCAKRGNVTCGIMWFSTREIMWCLHKGSLLTSIPLRPSLSEQPLLQGKPIRATHSQWS